MTMFDLFHQGSKVNVALLDFLVCQVVQEKKDHLVVKDCQQMEQGVQDPVALKVHRDRKDNLVTV